MIKFNAAFMGGVYRHHVYLLTISHSNGLHHHCRTFEPLFEHDLEKLMHIVCISMIQFNTDFMVGLYIQHVYLDTFSYSNVLHLMF